MWLSFICSLFQCLQVKHADIAVTCHDTKFPGVTSSHSCARLMMHLFCNCCIPVSWHVWLIDLTVALPTNDIAGHLRPGGECVNSVVFVEETWLHLHISLIRRWLKSQFLTYFSLLSQVNDVRIAILWTGHQQFVVTRDVYWDDRLFGLLKL